MSVPGLALPSVPVVVSADIIYLYLTAINAYKELWGNGSWRKQGFSKLNAVNIIEYFVNILLEKHFGITNGSKNFPKSALFQPWLIGFVCMCSSM